MAAEGTAGACVTVRDRCEVGPGEDQVLLAVECAADHGPGEGHALVERRRVYLGARGHQQLHRVQPAGVAGVVERRPAHLVPGVHVRAVSS